MRVLDLEFVLVRRIQTKKIVFYLLFVSLVFVSALSRLLFNGLYFNFDFGLYQPDGAHYLYRTLVFLGQDSISASNQATDWYRLNGYKNNIFDPGKSALSGAERNTGTDKVALTASTSREFCLCLLIKRITEIAIQTGIQNLVSDVARIKSTNQMRNFIELISIVRI